MITQSVPLMIFVLLMSYHSVAAQNIIIAFPGQNVDVELMCDVTGDGGTAWRINGTLHSPSELFAGVVAGHNISGRNLIVEDIIMNDVRNGSQYQCEITQIPPDPNIVGNLIILYVAGVPSIVPNVTVAISDVSYRLQWGEPFNNLDPIVNYTVSCSGDDSCPANFTTTDNATRSDTIANLIPMTNYTFSVVATNSIGSGKAGVVMIATPSGTPGRIPGVMINEDSVRINGSNVTLTLSWGEPSSYFGPIISHTVSWNDSTFLSSFTITDNMTRNYTITNLTPMTNYTFSVVAINSFGSGEAGILVDTTLGISQVIVTMLQCDLVNIINQCTVSWSWNSLLQNITNFLVISNVRRYNIPSQNASHTFPVLSLPGGAENGEIAVIVIAVNELGQGPPSEVARTNITVSSVINAAPMQVCTPAVSELYNITVTCTIHPDSTADHCVVMAMADGKVTRTGIAAITKGMATVTISDLQCGVSYNITAEGMLNETLVGSRSSHGSIAPRPCPMISTVDESDDEFSIGAAVAITFVTTFIIAVLVTALITYIITSRYYKHWYEPKEKSTVDDHSTRQKDLHFGDITMDTNPAYGTTTTIKMDTNPAYATTSH